MWAWRRRTCLPARCRPRPPPRRPPTPNGSPTSRTASSCSRCALRQHFQLQTRALSPGRSVHAGARPSACPAFQSVTCARALRERCGGGVCAGRTGHAERAERRGARGVPWDGRAVRGDAGRHAGGAGGRRPGAAGGKPPLTRPARSRSPPFELVHAQRASAPSACDLARRWTTAPGRRCGASSRASCWSASPAWTPR